MDFQTQAAIVFVLILALVLYVNRSKLQVQKILYPFVYVLMYRTKVGISLMDRAAKRFPRFMRYYGYAGVFIGFVGMGMICYSLIENLVNILIVPSAPSAVALVLPFKVKGTFFVPFFYWIICIFALVIVHEFSHGMISRLYDIKIKSSGLAFLGIILPVIPAAFVEPDEKKLAKRPRREQLSVFAAGSFSNIVFAFIALAVMLLVMNPLANSMMDSDGVLIGGLVEEGNVTMPAASAGVQKGEVIIRVDSTGINTTEDLSLYLNSKSPGDTINLVTNRTEYSLVLSENPDNSSLAYMGIYLSQHAKVKPSFEQRFGALIPEVIMWITGLIFWLFVLNLGIGLFNLVPIPITDGGRMIYLALLHYFEENKAKRIWKSIALFFVLLIIINIGLGFIR